jgi:hypothetical protein
MRLDPYNKLPASHNPLSPTSVTAPPHTTPNPPPWLSSISRRTSSSYAPSNAPKPASPKLICRFIVWRLPPRPHKRRNPHRLRPHAASHRLRPRNSLPPPSITPRHLTTSRAQTHPHSPCAPPPFSRASTSPSTSPPSSHPPTPCSTLSCHPTPPASRPRR